MFSPVQVGETVSTDPVQPPRVDSCTRDRWQNELTLIETRSRSPCNPHDLLTREIKHRLVASVVNTSWPPSSGRESQRSRPIRDPNGGLKEKIFLLFLVRYNRHQLIFKGLLISKQCRMVDAKRGRSSAPLFQLANFKICNMGRARVVCSS